MKNFLIILLLFCALPSCAYIETSLQKGVNPSTGSYGYTYPAYNYNNYGYNNYNRGWGSIRERWNNPNKYDYMRQNLYNQNYYGQNYYGLNRYRLMRTLNNLRGLGFLSLSSDLKNTHKLAWNKPDSFDGGTLTGYSVPVGNQDNYQDDDDDDIYYDYYTNKKVQNPKYKGRNNKNSNVNYFPKSTNCNTDLFSMPTQNNSYQKSKSYTGNTGGGVGGKTGVTIIWD